MTHPGAEPLTVLSSMATRRVLTEALGSRARLESVGGVTAAQRVRDGDRADVVVLAAPALDALVAAELLDLATRTDLFGSQVVAAVPVGVPRPAIGTVAELCAALAAARTIGYSTGPSGTALLRLFERWEIGDELAEKLLQAQPGVPVGQLLAEGTVDIGFQQHSELLGVAGIDVLGPLPPGAQIHTTFSAAVSRASRAPDAAADLLRHLRSVHTARAAVRHGLTLMGVPA